MIRTAAPSPQTQGAVPDGNPFLFSYPGGDPVDLRPALDAGANIAILSEALPAEAGPLYAKHSRRGKRISRPTALYYRLYRWLKSLVKSGLLKSEKGVQEAGLGDRPSVWYTTSITALGLIRQVQSSNHFAHGGDKGQNEKKSNKKRYKWLQIPKRCSTHRINAIKAAMSIKSQRNHYMFVRPDKNHLHPDLVQSLKPIESAYQKYLDEINDKEIILYDEDAPEDRFLVLPYRTRFNDRHRQLCNLDEFEAKFNEAEKYYDVAVFLTLTTAPGMHPNLWWANRHMSPAFNRYMSYLTKRNIIAYKDDIAKADAARMTKNGHSDDEIKKYQKSHRYRRYLNKQVAASGRSFRPRYICCNEFQENGLIHLHLLIFGRSWLALKSQIEEDWARCGQGRIIDVYAVRKTAPGSWVWANPKRKPADAKGDQDAKKYLKKYLNKAIYDQRGFEHYFTVNKRFFTASRNMSPAKQVRSQGQPAPAPITEPVDYIRDETKPRWRFGGAVASSNVISQIRYIADRCRFKFCRPSIDLNSGPPPVPSPWEEAAEMARSARRRRRDSPILRFTPASKLPRSGAADLKGLSLADFM